jgi:hypothetical protein
MKDITLNENNESILNLVNYIDSKIISLRKENQLPDMVISDLNDLYNSVVAEWMGKNYIFDIEPDIKEEEIIINKLLEIIDFLNKI